MNNRYLLLTLTEKIKLYSFKVFTIRNYCMERQKRMLEIIRYLKGQMYGLCMKQKIPKVLLYRNYNNVCDTPTKNSKQR